MSWKRTINRCLSTWTGFEIRRARRAAPSRPSAPRRRPDGAPRRGPLPPARLAPGTAVSSRFFDRHPRFFETSSTSTAPDRLNLRYEAIISQHRDVLQGARVLDIASHDGRWAFAALDAGASHVIGIEALDYLVANAEENLAQYGVAPDRYHFVAGDVYEVLATQKFDVDVVLCLGFLYHTLRYNELFSHVRALNPRHLLIDTRVAPLDSPHVEVLTEGSVYESTAVADRYSYGDRVLVGHPSVPALRTMLSAYDFEIEQLSDWAALLRDNPNSYGVITYARGKRVTARCRPTR
jgi:hypothetical protein